MPLRSATEPQVRVNLHLAQTTRERLEWLAGRRRQSLSAVVSDLVDYETIKAATPVGAVIDDPLGSASSRSSTTPAGHSNG